MLLLLLQGKPDTNQPVFGNGPKKPDNKQEPADQETAKKKSTENKNSESNPVASRYNLRYF